MKKLILLFLFIIPVSLWSEPIELQQINGTEPYASLATIIQEWQKIKNKDQYSIMATMISEWPRVKNKCPENIYHVIEYIHYMSDRDNLTHEELRVLLHKILEGNEKPTALRIYIKKLLRTAGHTAIISGSVVLTFIVCILLNQYVL